MRGVLLDPATGRPETLETRHRDLAARHALSRSERVALAQILGSESLVPEVPPEVAQGLEQARSLTGRSIRASLQAWEEVLASAVAAQTSVSGTSEAVLAADALVMLPAFYLNVSRTLKLTLTGTATTDASAGNLTLRLRWGGLTGALLVSSSALALTNSVTTGTWSLEFLVVCRAEGHTITSFSLYTTGKFGASGLGQVHVNIPSTGNGAVASLDGTIAKALSATAQMDNTGNSMTADQVVLEALN